MIVREEDGELLLVTQPDHAGLSAAVIEAWRHDNVIDPVRRRTILLAVREHDNGWIEVDGSPPCDVERGRPFDFITMPDPIKQQIWPRAVTRLGSTDAYAAALVAQHAISVMARNANRPEWAAFFTGMEDLLERYLLLAGHSRPTLERDYAAVELGDLMSLIFCNGWPDTFDARGYRMRLDGRTLRVSPDPFGGKSVPLSVPCRRLPARWYRTAEDLHHTLATAPTGSIAGTAVGE